MSLTEIWKSIVLNEQLPFSTEHYHDIKQVKIAMFHSEIVQQCINKIPEFILMGIMNHANENPELLASLMIAQMPKLYIRDSKFYDAEDNLIIDKEDDDYIFENEYNSYEVIGNILHADNDLDESNVESIKIDDVYNINGILIAEKAIR